jgi:hypothetical protein
MAMKIDVNITVDCVCGKILEKIREENGRITVNLCPACLMQFKYREFDRGYRAGFQEGKE